MRGKTTTIVFSLVLAAIPVALFARSAGAPVRRTGLAADGGQDCSGCHRTFAPANSDPAGSVTIEAGGYRPGVRQQIRVTVSHPEAKRWGFELTARPVSDPSKMAGSFEGSDEVKVECDDGNNTQGGTPPPCGDGVLQFATHIQAATLIGANGTKTYVVDWTPPNDDVGDILLSAAGNAANNDGTNANDRIYTTTLVIPNDGSCTLTGRPSVRTALNGASFQPGLSINSMFSIFGLGFQTPGRTRLATRGDFRDGKFPPELGCIAVEVNGKRAPIAYVQQDQINAQVPTINDLGPVRVQVILNPDRPNELRSDVATVTMQQYTPAFFTFDGTSIAAQIAGTSTLVSSTIAGARPAKPGETVTLYGTGFGVTNPVFQAGELPSAQARLRDPFTITIGGVTLASSDIQYAGLSPGSISGLYQFNVTIPASVPDGDARVVVQIGGVSTPAATIPVKR